MSKLLRSIFALFFVGVFFTITPPASQAVIAEQPCNQVSWTGEDDNAHQMSLPYNLPLGNTTYSTTYVTTNGTLTFGTPDANFSSYPNTPSISLAGYDWVTFGQGASLSYGVTDTGFCVEWRVRPFPQSSGNLTIIKLTVDTSRLPTWSGIVETTGWLPADLRRGIRFQPSEAVVQISEAFTINGGRPVEMQTCWDGTIIPMSGTCPAEPPPGQCWDGSTVVYGQTCPPVPPDTQCWDGTWVAWSQTCPPTPPDIICWDGQVVSWDATCRQVPPPVECWDGSEVNWDQQCPPEPPPTIVYPDDAVYVTTDENGQINYVAPVGMKINQILFASYGTPNNYQYGLCHAVDSLTLLVAAVNNDKIIIDAINDVFGDPCGGTGKQLSVVLTIEVDPTYVAPTPTPTPEPTQTIEPTPEPTPTPEPSPTIEPTVEPTLEPSPTPSPQPTETPTATPTPEPLQTEEPVVEPTPEPEPTPSETSTPEPTPTPESSIEPVEEVVDNAYTDGIITDEETQAIVDSLLSDGDLSTNELSDLVDNLQSEGQLSEEEKQLVSDVLVEAYADTEIPFDVFEASGLDYEDLPPEQPITLENGVIITAEIADAIEIFEDPAELLATVFTDPSKALKAISNVGSDMTAATRKDAQEVTVAAVIVSQVIAGTSALTLARK